MKQKQLSKCGGSNGDTESSGDAEGMYVCGHETRGMEYQVHTRNHMLLWSKVIVSVWMVREVGISC